MLEELKPCPFCGSDAEIGEVQDSIFDLKTQFYYIRCERDCADTRKEPTLEEVVKIWNNRH